MFQPKQVLERYEKKITIEKALTTKQRKHRKTVEVEIDNNKENRAVDANLKALRPRSLQRMAFSCCESESHEKRLRKRFRKTENMVKKYVYAFEQDVAEEDSSSAEDCSCDQILTDEFIVPLSRTPQYSLAAEDNGKQNLSMMYDKSPLRQSTHLNGDAFDRVGSLQNPVTKLSLLDSQRYDTGGHHIAKQQPTPPEPVMQPKPVTLNEHFNCGGTRESLDDAEEYVIVDTPDGEMTNPIGTRAHSHEYRSEEGEEGLVHLCTSKWSTSCVAIAALIWRVRYVILNIFSWIDIQRTFALFLN